MRQILVSKGRYPILSSVRGPTLILLRKAWCLANNAQVLLTGISDMKAASKATCGEPLREGRIVITWQNAASPPTLDDHHGSGQSSRTAGVWLRLEVDSNTGSPDGSIPRGETGPKSGVWFLHLTCFCCLLVESQRATSSTRP